MASSVDLPSRWVAAPLPLASKEVSVWWARRPAALPARTVDEQSRVGLHLLSLALSARWQVRADDWCVAAAPGGRPMLSVHGGRQPFSFSVAHTAGATLCAVVQGADVGVDIERVDARDDFSRLARRVCSPLELEALSALTPRRRRLRFLRYWTLKEARTKACGRGLAMVSLAGLAFDLGRPVHRPRGPIQAPTAVESPQPGWRFEQFGVGLRCVAALALRPSNPLDTR